MKARKWRYVKPAPRTSVKPHDRAAEALTEEGLLKAMRQMSATHAREKRELEDKLARAEVEVRRLVADLARERR